MDYAVTTNPVSPSNVNLREFALTGTTTLVWPSAGLDSSNTIANVLIVTSVSGNPFLLMPPANQGPAGYTTMIFNLGASPFPIQDNAGGAIDTIASGQIKIITLRPSSTAAGVWISATLGATTSAANAALLAGFGLSVITTTLNSNVPSTSFSSSQSFSTGNRAQLYTWTGGVGTASFPSSGTLTNGWWMAFRNAGSGALTLQATDSIDGALTETLNPGDACFVFCTGNMLFTVGIGRSVTITDTRTTVNVAGNTDVTLTSTQYANNILNLIGALTGNINVIVPSAIKNYYFANNTSGGYTLTVKTSAGTGVVIPQGSTAIVTCDGTNVIAATSSAAGTVTSVVAGTGLNGGTITGAGTISIANTSVVSGAYGDVNHAVSITINAQGQITAASQVQLNAYFFVGRFTSAADVNNQILASVSPSNYAIVDGVAITFRAAAANTGAFTINIGSTGAVQVWKQADGGLTPLVANDITFRQECIIVYNDFAGVYILLNPNSSLAANTMPGNFTGGLATPVAHSAADVLSFLGISLAGLQFNTQQSVNAAGTALTSVTYADTGLSVGITPTSASNKVLVRAVLQISTPVGASVAFQLVRGSTAVGIPAAAGSRTLAGADAYTAAATVLTTVVLEYLDSPATVSATTYKVQYIQNGGSGTCGLNQVPGDPDSAAYTRTVSVITVCEVHS